MILEWIYVAFHLLIIWEKSCMVVRLCDIEQNKCTLKKLF